MFMDLAFLLVSTLLLLVREPDDDEVLPPARIRVTSAQHSEIAEDRSLPGQSVRFFIAKNGKVSVKTPGSDGPVPCDEAGIAGVIAKAAATRTVILDIDREAPYAAVAAVREQFEVLKNKNEIGEILKTVRFGPVGKAD